MAKCYACGGRVDHYAEGGSVRSGKNRRDNEKGVHSSGSQGSGNSTAGSLARVGKKLAAHGEKARVYGEEKAGDGAKAASRDLHRKKYEELKGMRRDRKNLAEGGYVEDEMQSGYQDMPEIYDSPEDDYLSVDVPNLDPVDDMLDDSDIVDEIMEQRYSEGGQVANDVGEGQEADKMPNQFDDLVLRDELEFSYTGDNSGDHLGDESLDDEEEELVDGIMRKRKKLP